MMNNISSANTAYGGNNNMRGTSPKNANGSNNSNVKGGIASQNKAGTGLNLNNFMSSGSGQNSGGI